jgi:hypothetical protein
MLCSLLLSKSFCFRNKTSADHTLKDRGTAFDCVNNMHHTFHPLCVCGFGLPHPVFRAGLPVPQPLPPAPHALDAAPLALQLPDEGDAPEPELPPHAEPPPAGEVPQPLPPPLPPAPPAPPPPPVPGVPAHPEEGLASCPHPVVALGAGAVPLAGGNCAPLSPPRASRSFGSDLSPRMRLASFVCSSVRPYRRSSLSLKVKNEGKVPRHLHHNFLRA